MGRPKNEPPKEFNFNGQNFQLTDKQKLFCMEYVRNRFNGTKAALAAGYSEKNAKVSAVQILSVIDVSNFVEALKKDIAFCIGVSAIDIAWEYKRIGFSDIRNIFDENGNLINIKDIPDDPAANIASIEVFEEWQGKGAERKYIGSTKKIKFYDKVNALDKLAKMTGVDGVTKIAQTTTTGEDVILLPKKELHK
jgi:phage terminase small subunit